MCMELRSQEKGYVTKAGKLGGNGILAEIGRVIWSFQLDENEESVLQAEGTIGLNVHNQKQHGLLEVILWLDLEVIKAES